ncbi:MAG: hypothetical protein GY760_19695 [Deltaproteobacteria bacterium]|nr:hypothetical protein [Deltaproteobacteria bacterium]
MHSKSDNPQSEDLSAIIEGLIKSDIKFILVGGLAAVVQGAPVMTMDVDIVHDLSSENISKLFLFLESIDAIFRRPDDKIIAPKIDDISAMGHNLFSTRLGALDVLAFIEQEKTYEDLIEDSVEIDFRGQTVHVLDIKKIIELKKKSKNPKDKLRQPVLEETLRQLEKELNKQ